MFDHLGQHHLRLSYHTYNIEKFYKFKNVKRDNILRNDAPDWKSHVLTQIVIIVGLVVVGTLRDLNSGGALRDDNNIAVAPILGVPHVTLADLTGRVVSSAYTAPV